MEHRLDLEEREEEDIYKLDLYEALTYWDEAWGEVTAKTIKNGWRHTQIMPSAGSASSREVQLSDAQQIVCAEKELRDQA